jgi:hypothetical protein
MTAPYVWDAVAPRDVRELFRPFRRPWWIAGGWALDLHLGRETRPHEDIDIAILRGDEVTLARSLPDWEFCIADATLPDLTPWPGVRALRQPYHQFWVRREPGAAWTFEVLLEVHDSDRAWRYRRDARVTLPLDQFGRRTADGIPYVAPEIALLYKAKGHDIAKNAEDFVAAHRSLDAGARRWLAEALEIAHPEHPWLEVL